MRPIKESPLHLTLRQLTAQDFQALGADHVAYIRPITLFQKKGFALHAADGTPLSISDSEEAAVLAARADDLEPVRTH